MVSGVTCPFFLSRNALRLRIFCAILCLCLLKLPPGYRLHPEVQVTDPCRQSHELARGLLHLVCGHLAALQVPAFHLATVFPRLNKLHLTKQTHHQTTPSAPCLPAGCFLPADHQQHAPAQSPRIPPPAQSRHKKNPRALQLRGSIRCPRTDLKPSRPEASPTAPATPLNR